MTKPEDIAVEDTAGQSQGCTPGDPECMVCPPEKTVLTYEEEEILCRMRGIKEQVRPIAEKLKELQSVMDQSPHVEAEWRDLTARLEGFRAQWKDWEKKLDEAVEQKLIILGHRSPSSPGLPT